MNKLFPLLLLLAMAGCSNQVAQKTNQKAPTKRAAVDSSAIAVIPNPYVDDLVLANKAADEAKQELIKRGYNVVANEGEAQLIAVPTVETNVVTLVQRTSTAPIDMFSNSNLAQLDRTTLSNSLSSLGQVSFRSPGNSFGKEDDLLVIEAFPKDAWDHALIVNELQLQPAWKIRLPLPANLKPIDDEKIGHTPHTADTDFQVPH
jgi:hypothetical protein